MKLFVKILLYVLVVFIAYAKVIEGYYESFEKGFNWAGDRTMRELKSIFDNRYGSAKDIFKPNLAVNEAYNAIKQSDALLDDLTGTAYTIGVWGEEVFMKCVMVAGLFANRAGNYNFKANFKTPNGVNRIFPRISDVMGSDGSSYYTGNHYLNFYRIK